MSERNEALREWFDDFNRLEGECKFLKLENESLKEEISALKEQLQQFYLREDQHINKEFMG
jgi:chaperonin cofactor prefoldin